MLDGGIKISGELVKLNKYANRSIQYKIKDIHCKKSKM